MHSSASSAARAHVGDSGGSPQAPDAAAPTRASGSLTAAHRYVDSEEGGAIERATYRDGHLVFCAVARHRSGPPTDRVCLRLEEAAHSFVDDPWLAPSLLEARITEDGSAELCAAGQSPGHEGSPCTRSPKLETTKVGGVELPDVPLEASDGGKLLFASQSVETPRRMHAFATLDFASGKRLIERQIPEHLDSQLWLVDELVVLRWNDEQDADKSRIRLIHGRTGKTLGPYGPSYAPRDSVWSLGGGLVAVRERRVHLVVVDVAKMSERRLPLTLPAGEIGAMVARPDRHRIYAVYVHPMGQIFSYDVQKNEGQTFQVRFE